MRAADYINATRLRRKLTHDFHALFDRIDVVLTASSMDPACRIDDPQAVEYTYARQARAPHSAKNLEPRPELVEGARAVRCKLPVDSP